MSSVVISRVRYEDINDDLRQQIDKLLVAGKSSEAMARLGAQGYLEPTEVVADIPSLEAKILRHVAGLPDRHLKGEADGPAAALVHAELQLSPAQASDHGLWVGIAILGLKYVQSRWDDVPRHVWSNRSDHSWERLWWVGELLGVNGDYKHCVEFSLNTNATNEVNKVFVREKAWAIAYAQVVAHYNAGGKLGVISNDEINDLSKKLRILSRTVPLPTPFLENRLTGQVDEVALRSQVYIALQLIREQVQKSPQQRRCGFNWPD